MTIQYDPIQPPGRLDWLRELRVVLDLLRWTPACLSRGSATAATPRTCTLPGTPPESRRVFDENRGGWIQQVRRTFLLPGLWLADRSITVGLGTELTITADPSDPDTVGTTWRIFDLGSSSATDRRAVAFRLD